jgi:hypothetical protein
LNSHHEKFISGRSFVFITPYKGKKSGAFQENWLRHVKWLKRSSVESERFGFAWTLKAALGRAGIIDPGYN